MMQEKPPTPEEEISERFHNWRESDDLCPLCSDECQESAADSHRMGRLLASHALTTCPGCAYAIWFKALKSNTRDQETGEWQNLWLKHCLSDKTDYIFIALSKIIGTRCQIRIDRESSVKEILEHGLLPQAGPLRAILPTPAVQDYYLKVCEDWFLGRYAFKEAWWCFSNRKNLGYRRRIDWTKFLLPKIWGSILIGYLALVLSSDSWKLAMRQPLLTTVTMAFLALAVSAGYFLIEVNNCLRSPSAPYVARGLGLFVYAFLVSLVTGSLLLKAVSLYFIEAIHIGTSNFFILLLFYVPFALLIGIFVQMLWEEKPVAQPLKG